MLSAVVYVMEESVLLKYDLQIKRAKEAFSYGRDLLSCWSSVKIIFLSTTLTKPDFYCYLVESKFIVNEFVQCNLCNGKMTLQEHSASIVGIRWICQNKISTGKLIVKVKKCNGSKSIRTNTWFSNSKLRPLEIVLFTYFWWNKILMSIGRKEYHFSDRTLVDWASFCREVAIDQVLEHPTKICDPGKLVEIDESKFGNSMN